MQTVVVPGESLKVQLMVRQESSLENFQTSVIAWPIVARRYEEYSASWRPVSVFHGMGQVIFPSLPTLSTVNPFPFPLRPHHQEELALCGSRLLVLGSFLVLLCGFLCCATAVCFHPRPEFHWSRTRLWGWRQTTPHSAVRWGSVGIRVGKGWQL